MDLDSCSMLFAVPECGMIHLLHCLNCHSLRSACFHRFLRYYEMVRLLLTRHRFLGFLRPPLKPHWTQNFTHSRCCLRPEARSRLPYYKFTGLIGFTLSHFGSHTPLPTLKSGLAASIPRLSTDCWLCFVGSGLTPLYAINAFWRTPQFCMKPLETGLFSMLGSCVVP